MGSDRVEAEKHGFPWEEAEEPFATPCHDEGCCGSIGPHGVCVECLLPGDADAIEPCDPDGPILERPPEDDLPFPAGEPVWAPGPREPVFSPGPREPVWTPYSPTLVPPPSLSSSLPPLTPREFFAAGGPLSQELPGYAPREGQIALSEAIYENARQGRVLLAEGMTGVGKSLAAIVALALHGGRSLISTATLNLQDQYMTKDLPLANRALGSNLTFKLIKGRSNYLCLRKLNRGSYRPPELVAWSNHTTTGDRGELTIRPDGWEKVSSDHESCLGGKCEFRGTCWANLARAAAMKADIVVCNHMILALSLLYPILPADDDHPLDHLVVDEAHELEDYLRKALGWDLYPGSYGKWAQGIRSLTQIEEVSLAAELADELFMDLDRSLGNKRSLRTPPRDVTPIVRATQATVDAIQAELGLGGYNEVEFVSLMKAVIWGQTTIRNLRQVFEFRPQDIIGWLDRDDGRLALHSTPIPIEKDGRILLTSFESATLMSATLDIPATARDLGVADVAGQLVVTSPFDWRGRALICIPASMPLPPSGANYATARLVYEEQTSIHLRWVIERSGGGVLGLFSSNVAMRAARDFLARYPVPGVNVYVQGDGFERGELVRLFKADRNSVLLGVQSFWQGVDAPGDTCRAVVIDKLPFSTPEDVVEMAIQDHLEAKTGQSGFLVRSLPKAIVALRQGVGRLMRTVEDRGVVVLLDRRAARSGGKRYWQTIRSALPPAPVVESLAQIEQKLLEGR